MNQPFEHPWQPGPVLGLYCPATHGYPESGSPLASTVWPTANLAIFWSARLAYPWLCKLLWAYNGATVSGNIDVGLYAADYTANTGRLIVSAGSTAQAGISNLQSFNIADTTVGPGHILVGCALDNATGTLVMKPVTLPELRVIGIFQMATAFPLPATITLATPANASIPFFGGSNRTFL